MFKKLFQQTFIYGVATVLPRILGLFLVRFYIQELRSSSNFGTYQIIMSFMILGNVVLSYGMETAFFRFINKSGEKSKIQSTALTSIFISSIVFFVIGFVFKSALSAWLGFKVNYIVYAISILTLDALVVIPFAWFRDQGLPKKYSAIKILNVLVNLGFNLFFFLALPNLANGPSFLRHFYFEDKINYIFISNLIASGVTLLILAPLYFKIKFGLSPALLKKMLNYAIPILIAGVAFSINEASDKVFLNYLLPQGTAKSVVGIYAACYKMGAFMTLFIAAFKLGIEPFFFQHAEKENAKETYANITLYFTIFGTFILLFVVVYTDVFKYILMPKHNYWKALDIVPIILLANLFLGIYHNLSVWYKVTDKTNYGAVISVLGAVITIILNFLLIPTIGYRASAIATLAAYGSMMLVSYFIGKKKYPIPYNLKKIGLYFGTSIGFSTLSFYVFDKNIVMGNVLLLLFLGLIYILEKNEIQKLAQRYTKF